MSVNTPFELLIQVNSPGELSTWVAPLIPILKKHTPKIKISIFLVPCQYASGNEKEVALQLPNIHTVYSPKETLRFIFSFPIRKKIKHGAILYLGGDPLYSRLLSLKCVIKSYAYTEHTHNPGKFFTKIFKLKLNYDLMATHISMYNRSEESVTSQYGLKPYLGYCLFFCGSRAQHYHFLIPFFSKVIQIIKKRNPQFKPLIGLSPFIDKTEINLIRKTLSIDDIPVRQGYSLDLMKISKLFYL